VYIRPKGSTAKMDKVIEVRSEKLYRLQVESAKGIGQQCHRFGRVVAQTDGASTPWCVLTLETSSHKIATVCSKEA